MSHKFVAKAIKDAAVRMRAEADHLERLADKLVVESDFGYVTEAVTAITSVATAVRLDIIVSRLCRAVKGGSDA